MKHSLKKLTTTALLSTTLLSTVLSAQTVDVKITNLTKGIVFTPLLVAAHPKENKLYTAGIQASENIKAMAEGGDVSGLKTELDAAGAVTVVNNNPHPVHNGFLSPGDNYTTTLEIDDASENNYLSIVAMMLPTNDGFVGLNNVWIPKEAGTYKYVLNAHDAGTEANSETNTTVPGLANGKNATGVVAIDAEAEGYVHIHRGNVGDFNSDGGISDIDAATQRWLNPVASVVITVK